MLFTLVGFVDGSMWDFNADKLCYTGQLKWLYSHCKLFIQTNQARLGLVDLDLKNHYRYVC